MSTAEYQKAWRAKHGARTGVIGRPRTYEGCGSPAAYSRHIRKGEEVDQECRDAWRAYQAERRKVRKAAADKAAAEAQAKKDEKNRKVREARAKKAAAKKAAAKKAPETMAKAKAKAQAPRKRATVKRTNG